MTDFLCSVKNDLNTALEELYVASKLDEQGILVVGCSTSEINGDRIGSNGSLESAEVVFATLAEFCDRHSLRLAIQCCEHLNRSLVVEKETMLENRLTRVNAVPQYHAGGSLGTVAFRSMKNPVVVTGIQADMGIDIGDTLIGMHLRPVAVPVRTSVKKIGMANLVLARSRCPYVGGERAVYDNSLG